MGPSVSNSLSSFADLIDVTLADEDTNAILTDSANWAIQGNVAMQITVSDNANYATVASGAIWWSNMQIMQVVPSGGQIWK